MIFTNELKMSDETNHEEGRVEVEEEECVEVRVGKRISFMDPDGEFTDPGKKSPNKFALKTSIE